MAAGQPVDTHTCPGLCGRELTGLVFACPWCSPRLPAVLRNAIAQSWWNQDWPAHNRALVDGMHFFAAEITRRLPC
jgi:hypothetical protein